MAASDRRTAMLCYHVPNTDMLSREELETVTSFVFLLFMGSAGLNCIDNVIASWWRMRATLVFSPGLLTPEGLAYLGRLLTVDFVQRLKASGWHTNDSRETDDEVWRARMMKRDAPELVDAVSKEQRTAVLSYFSGSALNVLSVKQRAKQCVIRGECPQDDPLLDRAVKDLKAAFNLK